MQGQKGCKSLRLREVCTPPLLQLNFGCQSSAAFGWWVSRLVGQLVGQSVGRLVGRFVGLSVGWELLGCLLEQLTAELQVPGSIPGAPSLVSLHAHSAVHQPRSASTERSALS